LKTTRN